MAIGGFADARNMLYCIGPDDQEQAAAIKVNGQALLGQVAFALTSLRFYWGPLALLGLRQCCSVGVEVQLQTKRSPCRHLHPVQVPAIAHETEVIRRAFARIRCEAVLAIALAIAQFVVLRCLSSRQHTHKIWSISTLL